jgi:hypothetical protein
MFLGVKVGRSARLISSPPSVSPLSRKYESLDVTQPHGPPRPVTGISLRNLTFNDNSSCWYFWLDIFTINRKVSEILHERSAVFWVVTLCGSDRNLFDPEDGGNFFV